MAAGIVRDAQDRILICRRPAGKPLAGYWEFPGGKLKPREQPADALARELLEEVGIQIARSQPWRLLHHRYPDFSVELHVLRVLDWSGTMSPREGQRCEWASPADLPGYEFLPADADLVAELALPD